MASSVSPTAHLLRTSRLFSLPPPLKKVTHTTSISSTVDAFSPTATLPYPSHQAIETTSASLAKGDWGLKRPLPLKATTNTTTPIIRVSAIDTIDHITDFESAADHTLSLRKWQEMALPITVPQPKKPTLVSSDAYQPFRSVFEPTYDRIYGSAEGRTGRSSRWKFKGPWLAGQTEGEFQDYIKTTIRRKREEFRAFIKPWIERVETRENDARARNDGEDLPPPVRLSKSEFEEALVKLRHQPNRLYEAIWEFLDLPGFPPRLDGESFTSTTGFDDMVSNYEPSNPTEQGPPATHPSAGLSYLRVSAHMPNHPILGSQATQRAFQARVLRAKNSSTSKNKGTAAIGVGGFVSTVTGATTFMPSGHDRDTGWNNMDPDIPGGSKVWVFPEKVSIDSRGRVKFNVREAHANERAIWEGKSDARWDAQDPTLAQSGGDQGDFVQSGFSSEEQLQDPTESRSTENKALLPERKTSPGRGMVSLLDNILRTGR